MFFSSRIMALSFVLYGLGAVLAALVFPHAAVAGWHLRIEQKSNGLPFQADGTVLIEQYASTDAGLTILPDRTVILHLASGMMYELDRTAKTFTRTDLRSKSEQPAKRPESRIDVVTDLLQNAVQSLAGPLRVTPSNDYRQAVGFRSRRYDAENLAIANQIWATQDIKGYRELMGFAEKAAKLLQVQPLLQSMDLAGIIQAIDGVPVYMTTQMLGGTMTFMLLSIEKQPLAPDFFELPDDYRFVSTPN